MHVRLYRPADLAQLKAIHEAHGFDYEFPDLEKKGGRSRLFFSRLVLEHRGRILAAIMARRTAEGYLLLNPNYGTPEQRWDLFTRIHRQSVDHLLAKGFEDVHCWVPPGFERFGERLADQLGWIRDDRYTPFCKYLRPELEPVVEPEGIDGQRDRGAAAAHEESARD